jgi:glutamyl-tRNA synthetase
VLHLGSVRTALFCWLYARHTGGQYVLRIEDTDRARSTPENVEAILDGLSWLGLHHDEGPFFQTDRFDRYRQVIDEWLEEGKAYHCYCSKAEVEAVRAEQMRRGEKTRYNGRCRNRTAQENDVAPVVRFKNPRDGSVIVKDEVRGAVTFQNSELDDLIIARSDGTPTYNFTVVVDDYDMGITHVVRGDDHLNNTPRQMNMLSALDAECPSYAHLPMILGPDGAKLSKRHGAVDIREYRAKGYLPEAVLNYLVRLGWSHGDQEIFSIEEMIKFFDIADVNQSASTFNAKKLDWVNQQHIMSAPPAEISRALVPFMNSAGLEVENGPTLEDIAVAFRERAETLVDMVESARFCFEDYATFDAKAAKKNLRPVIAEPLKEAQRRLADLADWTASDIAKVIVDVSEEFELTMGKLGQPIRVAVTGKSVSPPIDVTLWLVGQKRTNDRLQRALTYIDKRAQAAGSQHSS